MAVRELDFEAPDAASLGAGSTNFQFWYRDPTGGPNGYNLSNAHEIVFSPYGLRRGRWLTDHELVLVGECTVRRNDASRPPTWVFDEDPPRARPDTLADALAMTRQRIVSRCRGEDVPAGDVPSHRIAGACTTGQ